MEISDDNATPMTGKGKDKSFLRRAYEASPINKFGEFVVDKFTEDDETALQYGQKKWTGLDSGALLGTGRADQQKAATGGRLDNDALRQFDAQLAAQRREANEKALSAEKWQDPSILDRVINTGDNMVGVFGGTMGDFWAGAARAVGANEYADVINQGARNLLADTRVDNPVGKQAQDVFGGMVSMIPMVAAAPMGPAGPMLAAGLFSAGAHMNSSYNEFIDAGMTHEQAVKQARTEAATVGALTAATVYATGPLAGKIARKVPALNAIVSTAASRVAMARGAAGAGTRIAVDALKEGSQEMFEQILTDVGTNMLRKGGPFDEFRTDIGSLEWVKSLAYTGLVGGLAGGGMKAGGEAMGAIGNRINKPTINENPSRKEIREYLEARGVTGEAQRTAVKDLNLGSSEGRSQFARKIMSGDGEIDRQINEWADIEGDTSGGIPFGQVEDAAVEEEMMDNVRQEEARSQQEIIRQQKEEAWDAKELEEDPETSEGLQQRQQAAREYNDRRGAEQLQRGVEEGRQGARSDRALRGQETRRTKQKELETAFEEGRGEEALAAQDAPKAEPVSKNAPAEGQINLFTGKVEQEEIADDSAAYEEALRKSDGIAQAEARIEARRQRLAELRNEGLEARTGALEGTLEAISRQIENDNLDLERRQVAQRELDDIILELKKMDSSAETVRLAARFSQHLGPLAPDLDTELEQVEDQRERAAARAAESEEIQRLVSEQGMLEEEATIAARLSRDLDAAIAGYRGKESVAAKPSGETETPNNAIQREIARARRTGSKPSQRRIKELARAAAREVQRRRIAETTRRIERDVDREAMQRRMVKEATANTPHGAVGRFIDDVNAERANRKKKNINERNLEIVEPLGELATLADEFASMGVPVVFIAGVDNAPPAYIDRQSGIVVVNIGLFEAEGALIDSNGKMSLSVAGVMAHEGMHAFEYRFPEEFDKLVRMIEVMDPDGWAQAMVEAAEMYDSDIQVSEAAALYMQNRFVKGDGADFMAKLMGRDSEISAEARLSFKEHIQRILRALYRAFQNRKSFRLRKANMSSEAEYVVKQSAVDSYLLWVFDTMRRYPDGSAQAVSPWGVNYNLDDSDPEQVETVAARSQFAFTIKGENGRGIYARAATGGTEDATYIPVHLDLSGEDKYGPSGKVKSSYNNTKVLRKVTTVNQNKVRFLDANGETFSRLLNAARGKYPDMPDLQMQWILNEAAKKNWAGIVLERPSGGTTALLSTAFFDGETLLNIEEVYGETQANAIRDELVALHKDRAITTSSRRDYYTNKQAPNLKKWVDKAENSPLRTSPPEFQHTEADRPTMKDAGQSAESAMKWVNSLTPSALKVHNQMIRAAQEGAPWRRWYHDTGKMILEFVGLDKNRDYGKNPPKTIEEKQKFAQAMYIVAQFAIFSPQAKIEPNYEFSIRAIEQFSAGYANHIRQADHDLNAEKISNDPIKYLGGTKINSFALNMLAAISPKLAQDRVTVDLWMMRIYGFENEAPTPSQYSWGSDYTRILSQLLNSSEKVTDADGNPIEWTALEVQAAIWSWGRSRWTKTYDRMKNFLKATSENKVDFEELNRKLKEMGYEGSVNEEYLKSLTGSKVFWDKEKIEERQITFKRAGISGFRKTKYLPIHGDSKQGIADSTSFEYKQKDHGVTKSVFQIQYGRRKLWLPLTPYHISMVNGRKDVKIVPNSSTIMDDVHIKAMMSAQAEANSKKQDKDLTIGAKGNIKLRLETWEDHANIAAYDTVIHNNTANSLNVIASAYYGVNPDSINFLSDAELAEGGTSFYESARDRAGLVTIEVRPSTKISDDHLSEWDNLSGEEQREITDSVWKSVIDSPAGSMLRTAGHIMFDWSSGRGEYEGAVSPNINIRMPFAMSREVNRNHKENTGLEQATVEQKLRFAHMMAAAFIQDSVGFHRFFPTETKRANAKGSHPLAVNAFEIEAKQFEGVGGIEKIEQMVNDFFGAIYSIRGAGIKTAEDLRNIVSGNELEILDPEGKITDEQAAALQSFADNKAFDSKGNRLFQLSGMVAGDTSVARFVDWTREGVAIEDPKNASYTVKAKDEAAAKNKTGNAAFKKILKKGRDFEVENRLAKDREIALKWMATSLGIEGGLVTGHTAGDLAYLSDDSPRTAATIMDQHVSAYLDMINDPREIGVFREVLIAVRDALENNAAKAGKVNRAAYDSAISRLEGEMRKYDVKIGEPMGQFARSIKKAETKQEKKRRLVAQGIIDKNWSDEEASKAALEIREQKGIKGFAKQIKNLIKRGLFTSKGLSADVVTAKMEKDGAINAAIMTAEKKGRRLERMMKKSLVKDKDKLEAYINRILHDADAETDSVLMNEMHAIGVSDELITLAMSMRDDIDRMSIMINKIAVDDDGNRVALTDQIVAAIDSGAGTYVHRSYRAYNNPKWKDIVKNDPQIMLDSMRLMKMLDPSLTEAGAAQRVNEILETASKTGDFGSVMSTAKIDGDALKQRKQDDEIFEPLRALLGEYKSPTTNYVKTITKQAQIYAGIDFLKKVESIGKTEGWIFDMDDPKIDPRANSKFGDGVLYRPLDRMRTYPEIAKAFEDSLGPINHSLLRMMAFVNAHVKWGKTVGSPVTHIRNVTGNIGFAMKAGHWNVLRSVQAVRGLFDEGLMKRALELGVIHEDVALEEIEALVKESQARTDPEDIQNRIARGIFKGGKKVVEAANKLYRAEDDVWKLYGFFNEMAIQNKIWGDTKSKEEIEKIAARNVRNLYPTYSMVPDAVKWFRRVPFMGTFISFTHEAIRTTIHAADIGRKEIAMGIKEKNAAAITAGARRLAGLAGSMAVFSALAAMMMDDEEEAAAEAMRPVVAPWSRHSTLLVRGFDEDGNPRIIDLSHTDPHSIMINAARAIASGIDRLGEGETTEQVISDTIMAATTEMFGTFLSEEIAVEAMIDVMRNSDRNQNPVYVAEEPFRQRFIDGSKHIAKAIQPGIGSTGLRIYQAHMGTADRFGNTRRVADEWQPLYTGFRTAPVNVPNAVAFKVGDYRKGIQNIQMGVTNALRTFSNVTDDQQVDAYDLANESLKNHWHQMRRFVKGIQKVRNIDDGEMVFMLTQSKMPQQDAVDLVTGIYRPPQITSERIASAMSSASVIGGPEKGAAQAEVIAARAARLQQRAAEATQQSLEQQQ